MTMQSNQGLTTLAERQMRNWALGLQMQQKLARDTNLTEPQKLIFPYVAISREAGVDAGSLAEAIAQQCGWKALGRELLDYMAEHDHLSRLALEFVDEQSVSWFHEMFGTWLDKHLVSQAEYVGRLGKLVLLAAQTESTVFVGRGIHCILPRSRGLAVRFIAPLKQRIRLIMEKRQCTEREAESFIETTDGARDQFVQRYFHHDVTDPHSYDLVINLAHVPRDDAIELVVREAKRREQRLQTKALDHISARHQSQV